MSEVCLLYVLVVNSSRCAHPVRPHDFIEFSYKAPHRISEEIENLYQSGLSLNDIAEQTRIARSTLWDHFKKVKIPIRSKAETLKGSKTGKGFKCGGHTPYGFAYLDGQLVINPKEQIVIRKILKLRQSGLSLRAISEELNRQKTPPRSGKNLAPHFCKNDP